MFDLVDACVEHLGVLPSQINLSNAQISELLTYHDIKRKSQNICGDCLDEDRKRYKKCFICGQEFSDEHEHPSESNRQGAIPQAIRELAAMNQRNSEEGMPEELKLSEEKRLSDTFSDKMVDKIEISW